MANKKTAAKKTAAPAAKKPMTKSQLVQEISDAVAVAGEDITKKQVKAVLESLTTIGHKQLKRQGVFTLPGFAKFRVVKRPATKARKGKNPFTGEEMIFKAKPASKAVRARPVKAVKDAVA